MPRQRTEITRPKGINSDLSEFELPPEVWSDGNNINFRRLRTNKTLGYSNPFEVTDLEVFPTYLMPFTDTVDNFWLYASNAPDSRILTTDGELVTEIGTGYGASREASWTGCNFNELLVLNNRLDHPQMVQHPYNAAVDLINWGTRAADTPPDDPGNYEWIWGDTSKCEVIRSYKNYLFAMDCYDQTGTRYPNMVRWSSPTELGGYPPSWDPDSPSEQAGLYPLADSHGRVVDGLTLGDYFVIYKTDAVWLVQFVGGDFVFSFRKLFGDAAGVLAKDCIAEFDGKHFVLATDGAYIHNASTKEEVMDKWVKDDLFLNVHSDYLFHSKVVADHDNQEIWIYYISKDAPDGEDGPWYDKALIWNWDIQEWTKRDLNGVSYITTGYVIPEGGGVDDWDSDPQNWDADETRWDGDLAFNQALKSVMLTGYYEKILYADSYIEGTSRFNPTGWVKKVGIDFGSDRIYKQVTRVVPHIISENPITIKLYTSDNQTSLPLLHETVTFDPSTEADVDCHVVGRYIGIQFESGEPWTLTGYTLEWEPVGNF